MHVLTKWLNRMAKILSFPILLFLTQQIEAQSINELTLDKAYSLARENYPLLKQKDLINRSAFLTIDNINKSFLAVYNPPKDQLNFKPPA